MPTVLPQIPSLVVVWLWLTRKSANAVVLSSTLKSAWSLAFRRCVCGRIDMPPAVLIPHSVPAIPGVNELVAAG